MPVCHAAGHRQSLCLLRDMPRQRRIGAVPSASLLRKNVTSVGEVATADVPSSKERHPSVFALEAADLPIQPARPAMAESPTLDKGSKPSMCMREAVVAHLKDPPPSRAGKLTGMPGEAPPRAPERGVQEMRHRQIRLPRHPGVPRPCVRARWGPSSPLRSLSNNSLDILSVHKEMWQQIAK